MFGWSFFPSLIMMVAGFLLLDSPIPNVGWVFLIGGESLLGIEIVEYSYYRTEKVLN